MWGSGSLPPHQLSSLRGKKRQTIDSDAPLEHKFNTRNSPQDVLTRQKRRERGLVESMGVLTEKTQQDKHKSRKHHWAPD